MTPFMSLRLYLNPAMRHSDMPLKRFYRSSFAPGLEFDEAGYVLQLISTPTFADQW